MCGYVCLCVCTSSHLSVCVILYVFMVVVGFDSIPCLMHACLHIPLLRVACFPRLVVAPGSHGTVIYNKGFPAHTLGRVMLPRKLSSEQCALRPVYSTQTHALSRFSHLATYLRIRYNPLQCE